jgi:hypothetical protein
MAAEFKEGDTVVVNRLEGDSVFPPKGAGPTA